MVFLYGIIDGFFSSSTEYELRTQEASLCELLVIFWCNCVCIFSENLT